MRPRIFITQPVAPSAIARLRAISDVDLNPDPLHIPGKNELIAAVRGHDILFCLLHDNIDGDIVRANPRLRAIASMSITPSNIDVAAATGLGIPVTATPRALLDDSTADIAFALLLAVGRRLIEADRHVRAGIVLGCQSSYLEARGVSGRTLGILGMGGVGRAMARRARAFGMKLLYHDPRRPSEQEEGALGLTWVPFEQLLADSDYVSIHAALTPQTRHLIGARELGLMKREAYLINTARGPIVDEAALIPALAERRIAGAGLDVYENEPDINRAYRDLPNVALTPHMGSAVVQVREATANAVVDNILAIFDGKHPPNCCNEEIYATRARALRDP
jgi:glyoxylate reductase